MPRTRILLAEDHAIVAEGLQALLKDRFDLVGMVHDGRALLTAVEELRPEVVIADISMPEVSGYELCDYVKKHSGAPVFLTAGAVEPVDEAEVKRVQADGVLKKPFEASMLLNAIGKFSSAGTKHSPSPGPDHAETRAPRSIAVIDEEQIRAAVTVALDAAMPAMIDEITTTVVTALTGSNKETPEKARTVEQKKG